MQVFDLDFLPKLKIKVEFDNSRLAKNKCYGCDYEGGKIILIRLHPFENIVLGLTQKA